MSAASKSIQAAPTTRSAGFAAFALILVAAALLVMAVGRLETSGQAGAAPAQVPAQAQHDHGWSSASTPTASWAIDSNSAATDAARHPSRRSVTLTPDGIRVNGAGGGGLLYNGIPYTAPSSNVGGAGGSTRGRFAQ